METLQSHEISDTQRDLLKSTRDIGQTLTLRKRLKHILKKYKAGLALTEEESNFLFRPRNDVTEDSDVPIENCTNILSSEEISPVVNMPSKNVNKKRNRSDSLEFMNKSFDNTSTSIQDIIPSHIVSETKTIPTKDVGLNLMEQFMKLKQSLEHHPTSTPFLMNEIPPIKQSDISELHINHNTNNNDNILNSDTNNNDASADKKLDGEIIITQSQLFSQLTELPEHQKHKPVIIPNPVDSSGNIIITNDTVHHKVQDNDRRSVVEGRGQSMNKKLNHVNRDDQIQVCLRHHL